MYWQREDNFANLLLTVTIPSVLAYQQAKKLRPYLAAHADSPHHYSPSPSNILADGTKDCATDSQCQQCLYEKSTGSYVCIKSAAPTCLSTDTSPQVCGNDDVTYTNECTLRLHSYNTMTFVEAKHVGACNGKRPPIDYCLGLRFIGTLKPSRLCDIICPAC